MSNEDDPPKNNRYIAWSLVSSESSSTEYPGSAMLQAWTMLPPDDTGYYLLFDCHDQDLLDGKTASSCDEDYIAELTTDKTVSSAIIIEKYTDVS